MTPVSTQLVNATSQAVPGISKLQAVAGWAGMQEGNVWGGGGWVGG